MSFGTGAVAGVFTLQAKMKIVPSGDKRKGGGRFSEMPRRVVFMAEAEGIAKAETKKLGRVECA
ncbi:MAG: hypothetical protein PHD01_15550 [Geobacteraceae bacterium]|nr:hypothetical protein [Geobacteraceae bacterium]